MFGKKKQEVLTVEQSLQSIAIELHNLRVLLTPATGKFIARCDAEIEAQRVNVEARKAAETGLERLLGPLVQKIAGGVDAPPRVAVEVENPTGPESARSVGGLVVVGKPSE